MIAMVPLPRNTITMMDAELPRFKDPILALSFLIPKPSIRILDSLQLRCISDLKDGLLKSLAHTSESDTLDFNLLVPMLWNSVLQVWITSKIYKFTFGLDYSKIQFSNACQLKYLVF